MKPSTVLKKARKLIERGWCRYAWAKTADNKFINVMNEFSFNSRKAKRFCALGAIYRASGIKQWPDPDKPHVGKDAQSFLETTVESRAAYWNNSQKDKRPVLRAFDRAIKLAEKEGR